jgi:hypothetical protein
MTSLYAQKFFPNPFGEGHVYRTGDIVTRLQVREIRRIDRRGSEGGDKCE